MPDLPGGSSAAPIARKVLEVYAAQGRLPEPEPSATRGQLQAWRQGGVEGEVLSPTQPYPTFLPQLVPSELRPRDAFGLTDAGREWCRETLEAFLTLLWDIGLNIGHSVPIGAREIARLAVWLCAEEARVLRGAVLDASLGLGADPVALPRGAP